MTLPFAIKFLKVPPSFKYISISEIIFPSFTLLFNKLLKFDGFIIEDSFFNLAISSSSRDILIFLFLYWILLMVKNQYKLLYF